METKHDEKELEIEAVKRELRRPILVSIRRDDEKTTTEPISVPDVADTVIEKPFHSNKPTWSVDAFDKNHPIPEIKKQPPTSSSSTPQRIVKPCPHCVNEKEKQGEAMDVNVEVDVKDVKDEQTQTTPYLCQLSWLLEPTNWPSWVRTALCVNIN